MVSGTHPVLAAQAEPALPAGHDLFGDDPVTDLDSKMLAAEVVDMGDGADELVSRDDIAIRGGGAGFVAQYLTAPW